MRINQGNYKPQSYVLRKKRKRIETLLSKLRDQCMITRNYAKPFKGFKNRLLTKIILLTVIQYLNYLVGRNINTPKFKLSKCTTSY